MEKSQPEEKTQTEEETKIVSTTLPSIHSYTDQTSLALSDLDKKF
jgi:hypothetical protein